jgi:hypothetical protein
MSIDKLALDSIALAAMVRAALHFGPRGDYLEVIEPSARSVFRAAGSPTRRFVFVVMRPCGRRQRRSAQLQLAGAVYPARTPWLARCLAISTNPPRGQRCGARACARPSRRRRWRHKVKFCQCRRDRKLVRSWASGSGITTSTLVTAKIPANSPAFTMKCGGPTFSG